MTTDNNIIIGSGITGLYLAYNLLKKDPNSKIIIIEKNSHIGGRVLSCKKNGFVFSSGAGRFSKNHKYLFKLIDELGLSSKVRKVNKDRNYYLKGQYINNENDLLKLYKIQNFKSIKEIWEHIFNYKHDTKIMRELNLKSYLHTFLDNNIVELITNYYGFHSEMYNYNAYNAIKSFKYDFDIIDDDFFYLSGGLSQIIDNIYNIIIKYPNVKFIMNNQILDINDKQKFIRLNNKTIKYEKLYLTIKKDDFINIPYFKNNYDLFNSVESTTLLRIHAKYDNNWFKDIPVVKTDNPIMCIIPILKKKGLIQISYTDSYYSNFWKTVYDKKQLNKYLNKYLKDIFPNYDIPEPKWISFNYWKNGVHFWKPGYNSNKIIKNIKEIYNKNNIFIISESYVERQAWIDGTLEVVNKIL